jgi:hypothetical protein
MPQEKKGRAATAEIIAALIRIYRSAVASGDQKLAESTAVSLARYGILVADLAIGSGDSMAGPSGDAVIGGDA